MEIQIFIKTVDNKQFPFLVNTNITVLELKQRLQYEINRNFISSDYSKSSFGQDLIGFTETGINHRGIRLIFQGYPMSDDKILSSFNELKDNSVIHLIRQMY